MSVLTAAQTDQLPTTVAELTPGLLVFCDRPSRLQSWAQLFGLEWRHVGMTVQTDDGLMLAGYGRSGRYDYIPLSRLANYRRIAVARVLQDDEQVARFNDWCRSHEAIDKPELRYTTSAPLVGPILQMTRVNDPGRIRLLLRSVARKYCSFQTKRYGDTTAFVCSTFVRAAVDAARDVPMRLPVTAHPDDMAAYALPAQAEEQDLARWLCSPADLWNTVPSWDRAEIELHEESFVGIDSMTSVEEIHENATTFIPEVSPAECRDVDSEPRRKRRGAIAAGTMARVALWSWMSNLVET